MVIDCKGHIQDTVGLKVIPEVTFHLKYSRSLEGTLIHPIIPSQSSRLHLYYRQ